MPRASRFTMSAEEIGALIKKFFDLAMEGRTSTNKREYREVPSPEMRAFLICRGLCAMGLPAKLNAFERQVHFNVQTDQPSTLKQIAWVISVRNYEFSDRGDLDWKEAFNMQVRWIHDTVSIESASSWTPSPRVIVEYLGGNADGAGVIGIERWSSVEARLFAEGQAYLIRKGSRGALGTKHTAARL